MEVDNADVGSSVTSQTADGVNGDQRELHSPDKTAPNKPDSLELEAVVGAKVQVTANSDVSPQEVTSDKRKKIRRKHRGGKHHRKWKPYSKMTWDERKALEEKERRRATKRREERFASGQAMAPYNTTQFLMDIHDPDSPYGDAPQQKPSRRRRESIANSNHDGSNSIGTSDEYEYQASSDEEEIFLEKEFSVDYENFHAEHLRSLTKDQLVKEYLELELKCESLEKRLRSAESVTSDVRSVSMTSCAPLSQDDLDELQRLRADNEQLRQENEQLKAQQLQLVSQAAAAENKENKPTLEN